MPRKCLRRKGIQGFVQVYGRKYTQKIKIITKEKGNKVIDSPH
jgi:hypothetical protein